MALPLESVYQELILKHYRSSAHRGEVEQPDAAVAERNPLCGDDIFLTVRVRGGIVEDVRFSGHGCAISQAAASMMCQHAVGKSWDEIHVVADRFRELVHGSEEAAKDRVLGDMRALAGVAKLPRRVKCAMLGWDALSEAEKQVAGSAGPA
ncbi:MAG: SUF system NifU family Fe-S cluster assembly protein [Gemmatimonadetes bacterium]|nr:SUF system NifU family Fe-S cluster assembly protein [Gemmatimonadota bacterium]